jgi:DUF1680 family protein
LVRSRFAPATRLIGLARIHELNGKPEPANAVSFVLTTVTEHHSHVVGGNADREYFSASDTIAEQITEQTCEHRNTYNMLKLTRHLYNWKTNGAYFDYYERASELHDGGAGSRFFLDQGTPSFGYRVPPSEKRRGNRENRPRPEGMG